MTYAEAQKRWNEAVNHHAETERAAAKIKEEYKCAAIARFEQKQKGNDPGTRAELEKIEAREAAAYKAEELARIEAGIWRDNARAALLEELKPAALEILKKYSGKTYGPKTREKIADEAAEKTGYYMYLKTGYVDSEISFTGKTYRDPWRHGDLTLNYYHANNSENKPVLDENKIRLDSFEQFHDPRRAVIVEDTATRAAEIITAYREAEAAAAAWEKAKEKYNKLIPSTVCRRIEYDESRPRYMFK